MAHESSIILQSTRIGVLRVDPLQIRPDPEASRPTLVFPLGIELYKGESDLFLDRLEAVLTTRPPTGPRRRLGLAGTISGTGGQHGLLNSQPQGAGPVQAQLRIELLGEDLRLLDELVQSATGTVAELSLVFDLRVCLIREVVLDNSRGTALDVLPLAGPKAEELQSSCRAIFGRVSWPLRSATTATGSSRSKCPHRKDRWVMAWCRCSMLPAALTMPPNGERASRSAGTFATTSRSTWSYKRKNASRKLSRNV